MTKRPLIIDCDPGVDDAQCIMMLAACGRFDIRGITPVHGNVPLKDTARNSLFLRDLYGIDCPVCVGAEEAIIKRMPRAEYAHGAGGLGGYEYTLEREEYDGRTAWELMWEEAKSRDGELEIIAVGPLTNLAVALLVHPELPQLVKQVTIMGGAATAGNSKPYSEFNIYQDPHAAEIVLKAGFRSLTMVDLDTCHTCYFDASDRQRILALPETNRVSGLMKRIIEFRQESLKRWKFSEEKKRIMSERMISCDAVAAAVCIDPSMAQTVDRYVFCECRGTLADGQTVVDRFGLSGEPNVRLCTSVDRKRFTELFFECVGKFDEGAC